LISFISGTLITTHHTTTNSRPFCTVECTRPSGCSHFSCLHKKYKTWMELSVALLCNTDSESRLSLATFEVAIRYSVSDVADVKKGQMTYRRNGDFIANQTRPSRRLPLQSLFNVGTSISFLTGHCVNINTDAALSKCTRCRPPAVLSDPSRSRLGASPWSLSWNESHRSQLMVRLFWS
jgi:hypothetical protein